MTDVSCMNCFFYQVNFFMGCSFQGVNVPPHMVEQRQIRKELPDERVCEDFKKNDYGSMYDEIIRYIASTILIAMSVQGDPMTMRQIKGEVNYEDIKYVPEALQYLQEKGLLSHHTGYDGYRDLYLVPGDVEEEVNRVCICAIADNINKIKQGGNTQ